MRGSLMVTGLLSAALVILISAPSHTQDLSGGTSEERELRIPIVAGNPGKPKKDGSAATGMLPLPMPGGGDGPGLPPPWIHGEYPFAQPIRPHEDTGLPPIGAGPGGDWPGDPALSFAAQLSALELYVGIGAAQIDAWRAYTSAFIAFLEPPAVPWAIIGPPSPPATGRPAMPAEDQRAVPLFAEILADGAIVRAKKARSLKQAIDILQKTLRPEQLDKLAKADHPFGPLHLFAPPLPPEILPSPGGDTLPLPLR